MLTIYISKTLYWNYISYIIIFEQNNSKQLTTYIVNSTNFTIYILHWIANIPKSQKLYVIKIRYSEHKYCSHDGDNKKKYNTNINNSNIKW